MFPTAGSHIYRNEMGEITGWDNESSYEPEYCDMCGINHPMSMTCDDVMDYDEEESDEDAGSDLPEV